MSPIASSTTSSTARISWRAMAAMATARTSGRLSNASARNSAPSTTASAASRITPASDIAGKSPRPPVALGDAVEVIAVLAHADRQRQDEPTGQIDGRLACYHRAAPQERRQQRRELAGEAVIGRDVAGAHVDMGERRALR